MHSLLSRIGKNPMELNQERKDDGEFFSTDFFNFKLYSKLLRGNQALFLPLFSLLFSLDHLKRLIVQYMALIMDYYIAIVTFF